MTVLFGIFIFVGFGMYEHWLGFGRVSREQLVLEWGSFLLPFIPPTCRYYVFGDIPDGVD